MWTQVYCHDGAPASCQVSPTTLLVDLLSFDSLGVETDRVSDLLLSRAPGDDGDPDHLVYYNDLGKPIVLVDVPDNLHPWLSTEPG